MKKEKKGNTVIGMPNANLPQQKESVVEVSGEVITAEELAQRQVFVAEIKGLDETMHFHRNQMLVCMAKIGQKLIQAKALIGHGNFGTWCKNELNYAQRTANNYMRIYEEYQANGLLENSQEIASLPYTKAISLLALEAEDRKAFVEEHNMDELTNEKLQKELEAIKKEKEELQKAMDALATEKIGLETKQRDLESLTSRQREEAIQLTKQIDEAEKARRSAEANADKKAQDAAKNAAAELKTRLKETDDARKKAEEEIATILEKQSEIETAIKEAATKKAEEEAEKKWSKNIKEMETRLSETEKKVEEARKTGNEEAKALYEKEEKALKKEIACAKKSKDDALKRAEEAEKKVMDTAVATSAMKIQLLTDNLKEVLKQIEKEVRSLQKNDPLKAQACKEEANRAIETFLTKVNITVVS